MTAAAPIPGGGSVLRYVGTCLALAWRTRPGSLIVHVLAALLAGVAPIAAAWLTKLILDGLAGAGPVDAGRLGALVLALAAVGVLTSVLPHLKGYTVNEIDRGASTLMRRDLFAAVNRLAGLRRLEDPIWHDRLQLAQRASTSGPRQAVAGLTDLGQALVTLAGFIGALAVLSPWMVAIVVLAAAPALVVELALNRLRARVAWRLGQPERRDMFYKDLLSGLPAAKEIRLFGLGRFFGDAMMSELATIHRERRQVDRRELRSQGLLSLLGGVVSGAGLVWAVQQAISGAFSVGDVTVFVAALASVHATLGMLAIRTGNLYETLLLFKHHDDILRTAPDLAAIPAPRPAPVLRRGIELRDVWFRYSDEHQWTLRGVNLRIPYGSTVALVGPNGAGKSTLIKLLCRFYDPTRGAILWDGVDLREMDVDSLRRRLGAVFQDFMEYDLSAGENIALGDIAALDDSERIVAAAGRAGIHDDLARLPQGYQTQLTRIFFGLSDRDDPQTGVVLSGGQWQRLALARAFVRGRPDLLILDEPSAGLDAEAEAELCAKLREHRTGATSVLISHRLNTVREADVVAVLSGGRIVEHGGHRELMAGDGVYRRLFDLQARGYQLDTDVTMDA